MITRLIIIRVKSTLADEIKAKQVIDSSLLAIIEQVEQGTTSDYAFDQDGVLCFKGQYCVHDDAEFQHDILSEAHSSPYTMHPSEDKMYRNLGDIYCWIGMKKDISDYVDSIRMTPYKALYGHRCCTSIYWTKLRDRKTLGPDSVRENEDTIRLICDRLKEAFDRQKSYIDQLNRIHDVFHVSILRLYHPDLSHFIQLDDVELMPYLSYDEELVQILGRDERVLRSKRILMVKVQWSNSGLEKTTWETKESMET
ncbi:uncharacterized protein LOC120116892 [Hibiscus syriacus]|uniref:uncharacterized protein LOC120116892 n=1 Tax=Hibiscus syriacus TaxID=106335 RepID=UPI0019247D7E|nr:uncharacterized protein LOC120116892 [Hibiscus syriacus]